MQSNLGSTFGTTICYNGNPSLNFLQIQQQQQQQQQNLLNAPQLNASNTNLIAQSSIEPLTQPQNDTTFTKIFVGGLISKLLKFLIIFFNFSSRVRLTLPHHR